MTTELPGYAELHCLSAFSFQRGASIAEELFARAAERLGIAPAELLMVGDSANDALTARNAGCPVYLVPHGYADPSQFDCDRVLRNTAELLELIG